MAYNEKLADLLREALADLPDVEEKKMFRGVTFMVDGKMCISVSNDELMCRIDPAKTDEVLEMNGVRPMVMRGKTMKGYVYIAEEGYAHKTDLEYWIHQCLAYNKVAKAAKKKK